MSAIHRLVRLAMASAIGLSLTACGGGGGGGGFVDSTPPPPPPPPISNAAAPERATVGAGPASVFATAGGPNFTTGPAPGTAFPMLQTAMTQNGTRYFADPTTNAAGGTATFSDGQLTVDIPGNDSDTWSGYADLDWTRAGSWAVPTDWFSITNGLGAFVIGYQTPAAAVPTTGTATFSGLAEGTVFNAGLERDAIKLTGGTASFTADFGARTVDGSVTGMVAVDAVSGIPTGTLPSWNDFAFSSTITTNSFSGETRVTSTPGGITSLAGNATGTIEGRFFGPSAQEAGAVWTLFDGTKGATGTLTGKRP